MRIGGNASHKFSEVPSAEIPRSSFDRSHQYKTTFNAGLLIPVFCDEALPGDTFSLNMTAFARMATPIHPVMDNIYINSFFFAVPLRLVWDNFQAFMGEQTDPDSSTDFLVPEMTVPGGGYDELSLSDYLGLPTKKDNFTHMSLYHRAYNLIYNEWFRDQNLQNSAVVDRGDGPDNAADYFLRSRGKRHDYFTSALPWPQKGDSVELPLGTSAPLTIGAFAPSFTSASNPDVSLQMQAGNINANWSAAGVTAAENMSWADPQLTVDLTGATAATINELRQAFQIQKLYERDARGGTRYIEIIKSHFGVTSPDARLQRPEYLGGSQSTVNVAPVAQSVEASAGPGERPLGSLGAFATSTMRGHGFTKSFVEHSIVIGMISVRADLNYQQGLNRKFSRSTRWDYYWPALAMLGEQAILNKEIFLQGDPDDENVFGYQERFAEYRYKPNEITGLFRSNAAQSLDPWHLAQEFATLPTLSDQFITEKPPMERVLAVTSEPQFLLDSWFRFRCARPMPVYGVPGLIDHF